MKEFHNLAEATTYHRRCYCCKSYLNHNLVIGLDPAKCVYKWNLSEHIDSETDDWIVVNAYTNHIDSLCQSRRVNNEIIYDGLDANMVNRFQRYSKNLHRNFTGIIYESIHVECLRCYQFSYTIQVVIDMTLMTLKGIYLNNEFISYEDDQNKLHEINNVYASDKTEYTWHVTPTRVYDASKKHISIPIIPLNLEDPAESVARIKKLVIFS